jgi:hypothetical protein
MADVNKTTDSVDPTSSEVNTTSQTKIEIRKILDEVYETGYAWGNGSKPELNANDVHEKALAAIQAIVQAAEVRADLEARINELKNVQTYWFNLSTTVPRLQQSPPPVKQYISNRILELTKQPDVSL